MAYNVFGVPITDETVKGLTKYHKKESVTQNDRAKVALQMKNAEGKDLNARNFVNLQERFGESDVATICMIYNATGDPITLRKYHNWAGHLAESPFPVIIYNGQWGVFVHGSKRIGGASVAALVYSAKNNQGKDRHWLVSWSNTGVNGGNNKLFAEIQDTNHYDADGIWDNVKPSLDKGGLLSYTNTAEGVMFVSIGQVEVSVMEAILTLPEALV